MKKNRREQERLGIAVDLGTSMIGMALVQKKTGIILAEHGFPNPQKIHGADVAARIQYGSNKEGARELRKIILIALVNGIQKLQREIEKQWKVEQQLLEEDEECLCITDIVIAGNTAMLYLLQGRTTNTLGVYPFEYQDVGLKTMKFQQIFQLESLNSSFLYNTDVILFPCSSAFIGGDILSGLYYLHFDQLDEPSLFLDLGTNGEMALGGKNKIITASVAAGPAFEASLCGRNKKGSAFIEEIVMARCRNLIDFNGTIKKKYFHTGIPLENGGFLTQKHLRKIQLAKGAVIAGVKTLVESAKISLDEITKVYLAGSFGFHLKISSAVMIGMLPKSIQGKVQVVGNTSLLGGIAYLMDQDAEQKVELILRKIELLHLAEEKKFQEYYLKGMELKPFL